MKLRLQNNHSVFYSENSKSRLLSAYFKSLLELVNTAANVNELLLTCEEGMTLGANFYSDLAALGGLGCYCFAACATNYTFFIIGVYSGFHCFFTSFLLFRCSLTSVHKHRYYTTRFFILQ